MNDDLPSDSQVDYQSSAIDALFAGPRTELLSEGQTIFGDDLTTVIVTGTWSPTKRHGTVERSMTDSQEIVPRNAVKIAEALITEEAPATIQAWFVGRNPLLHGRAPANAVSRALAAVREAAEQHCGARSDPGASILGTWVSTWSPGQIRPCWTATAIAWRRLPTSSFARIWATWPWTVRGLRNNRPAIS